MAVGTRRDDGFTLVELMVVILVIALLLAIAIPTFFGAVKRSQDRNAQGRARNALVAQLSVYSDSEQFSEDAATLSAADASLTYVVPPASLTTAGSSVFVDVATTHTANDTIVIAARSGSGRCFWIRRVGTDPIPRFAEDACSGTGLAWQERW